MEKIIKTRREEGTEWRQQKGKVNEARRKERDKRSGENRKGIWKGGKEERRKKGREGEETK